MGNPAGGLLLLLVAIFLLVQFFNGGLDWLFKLRVSVDQATGTPQPGAVRPAWAGPAAPFPLTRTA